MADLLTVYEDDQANTFIDCMICDKRIRGDTHYKIHVTTIQHLKKEDALVAQGQIPRQPALPEWTDIRQYLEYLNLDEPIIGLGSLIQMPDHVTDDGKSVLKYKCRMCFVEMDLYSIVAHIVGRKHRQKYLELKRPDLVTWNDSAQKQPGLVARAKAAVVEKQEGWGTPVPLKKPPVFQGSDLRSNAQQQPYHGRDFCRTEDMHKQKYFDEERHGGPYYTGDKYDRPNPGDSIGHQSYSEENRHQRQYEEANVGGRLLRGDQDGRRLREDYEENLGRGQFSRGDRLASVNVQEKGYHEGVPKNRFNDKDLRIHRPGASEYQKEKMEGSRFSAYEDRKSSTNPVSMHGRSSYDEDRRGTVREFHSRTWDKANEMQGYPHMLEPRDPRAYSQDGIPAKKKRKSRFSDATAEEIAFAHMRHSNNNPRGAPDRALPPLFNNQFGDSGSASHINSKEENVLDIFNDIEIENMDDARFLKEKLCTVLKEFQATKAARAGSHTSHSPSDHRGVNQTDQRRDAYKDIMDDPDGMYLQNRNYQESRQYENDPRATRRYGGDYQESKRFDGYSSDLQEARTYSDDPRGFQKSRVQENPQNLPERRRYDNDLREKEQRYEEYSRADAPRGSQETFYERYHENDYRGNLDSERNWEHHKGRPLERFDDRGPADVERGFQERFGKPSFQPTSLKEDARMYVGRAQQRSHQNERQTGDELYDPFNPSSSPPPEASSSTSLDKIASTLLELVARR